MIGNAKTEQKAAAPKAPKAVATKDIVMPEKPKASFDVWLRWADVLTARLDTVRTVYAEHTMTDVASKVATHISRLRFVLDGALAKHLSFQPYATLNQLAHGEEKFTDMQIQALSSVFRAVLIDFPETSKDMQKLLNSRWEGNCNGRQAMDLFRGPMSTLNEGIGSGHPRDGQLPGVLEQLLRLEETGSARTERQTTLSAEEQTRWQETARRWATMNSNHLRGAGRLD